MEGNTKAYLILFVLGYVFLSYFFVAYFNAYNIPFGRHDVDNYLEMLKANKDFKTFFLHMGFISLINGLSFVSGQSVGIVLTYFVPFYLLVIIPGSLYYFYRVDFSRDQSIELIFWTLCGSASLTYFGVVSLWAQMLAYPLLWLSLGFFVRNKIIFGWLFSFLSILVYPATFGAYVIILCAASFSKNKRVLPILFVFTILFFLIYLLGFNPFNFTRFNDYGNYQPSIYQLFFEFLFPIFWIFLFFVDRENIVFVLGLFFLSFFFDLGRAFIMVLPVGMVFFYWGYLKFLEQIEYKTFFRVCFFVGLLLFSDFILSYFIKGMIAEFTCQNIVYCRNLDPNPLFNIFFINR